MTSMRERIFFFIDMASLLGGQSSTYRLCAGDAAHCLSDHCGACCVPGCSTIGSWFSHLMIKSRIETEASCWGVTP